MDHSFAFQGFCGWQISASSEENHVNQNNIKGMQNALNTSYTTNAHLQKDQGCISTSSLLPIGKSGCATIIGNPHWQSETYQILAQSESNVKALITAYKEYGNNLCNQLSGSYAFIISDTDRQCFLAATDKLARFPIYYFPLPNGIVFGTTASSVMANSNVSYKLRKDGIYDYVYFHMLPSPPTIFKGLYKLQAGKLLELTNQTLNITNHWLPSFKEQSTKTFKDLGVELKNILKGSVSKAMEGEKAIGAFLSGGLDSSTVVGMMSELIDGKGEAFSIGFSAKGYDEMEYARITAKHFGVHLNEYYVTPDDVVQALPMIATSYDEPFGNSSALPAYFCAKFAKENGIKRLLAGDGGDELFAGNERYAKQTIFENYSKIPSSLRDKLIEPVITALSDKVLLTSKIKSYINQANTPLPDRLQSYNFLHRHSTAEVFAPGFIEQATEASALELQREIYSRPKEATILNRMLYQDWQLTLADNDLRKVSHMCALAGIDVAYPMIDDNLLEFSTTIPSKWKLKGKKLRNFYKKSLSGWLPNETISKSKQGFGLPFGVWMQEHKPLQEMAYDNLLALKNRHYFNNQFIDHLIQLHKEGHAAYYGELIWILTVFELWMNEKL